MARSRRNIPILPRPRQGSQLQRQAGLNRQERASAAAIAAADEDQPMLDAEGNPLPPPMDPNMPSRPLDAKFWVLAPIGLAVAVVMGLSHGFGGALTVAAAWALGMVAYAVIRDPPPPKPRTEVPPGMNFGRSAEERQSGIIRTTTPGRGSGPKAARR